MGVQTLAQTLKESIVLPQHETARVGFTEPAFFTWTTNWLVSGWRRLVLYARRMCCNWKQYNRWQPILFWFEWCLGSWVVIWWFSNCAKESCVSRALSAAFLCFHLVSRFLSSRFGLRRERLDGILKIPKVATELYKSAFEAAEITDYEVVATVKGINIL